MAHINFCWKGYFRAIKRVTGLEIKIEVVDHSRTESRVIIADLGTVSQQMLTLRSKWK